MIGANNTTGAFQDFKELYKTEFTHSINEYNKKQIREDRKIKNYFEKISDDKKTELATEIIIQVGDMDFWKNKNIKDKKLMNDIFKQQLEKLVEICPNF
ncbi:Uncharacterised protein [Streptobacillus moniliformis]|nr:Uncharacterised protein [Streptobacillus moniliformis]